MESTQIIKRPVVTEKSTWESSARNRYSFVVDPRANKQQIGAAVAELYKVRVLKVSTQVRKGEYRKTRWGETRTPQWKKAIVQVHPEDKIEVL